MDKESIIDNLSTTFHDDVGTVVFHLLEEAYEHGWKAGYDEGDSDGFKLGRDDGYEAGYRDAEEDKEKEE